MFRTPPRWRGLCTPDRCSIDRTSFVRQTSRGRQLAVREPSAFSVHQEQKAEGGQASAGVLVCIDVKSKVTGPRYICRSQREKLPCGLTRSGGAPRRQPPQPRDASGHQEKERADVSDMKRDKHRAHTHNLTQRARLLPTEADYRARWSHQRKQRYTPFQTVQHLPNLQPVIQRRNGNARSGQHLLVGLHVAMVDELRLADPAAARKIASRKPDFQLHICADAGPILAGPVRSTDTGALVSPRTRGAANLGSSRLE
jgi:hypothetical protein